MDQGDIGFIFPNIIHHYQVFSCQHNQAIYLNASPFLVDRFTDILENKAPKPPVIKAFSIEPDVYHAFNSILGAQKTTLHWSRRICRLSWQDVSRNFSWLRKVLLEAQIWSTVRYPTSPGILSIPLLWKVWPEIWASANMFCQGYFLKHSIKTSTSTWMMPGWDMHVSDLKIPMIQSRSSALTVDLKVCAPLTVRLRKSSKLPQWIPENIC